MRMDKEKTQSKPGIHFLVVTFGYYGAGNSMKEAANNCVKAGSPKTLKACVIVSDKKVHLRNAFSVDYPDGCPGFQADFTVRSLGALL